MKKESLTVKIRLSEDVIQLAMAHMLDLPSRKATFEAIVQRALESYLTETVRQGPHLQMLVKRQACATG